MDSFFRKIAKEKHILNDPIHVKLFGCVYVVSVEQIIDLIEILPDYRKEQIKDMFILIDRLDGDPKRYITILAELYIRLFGGVVPVLS